MPAALILQATDPRKYRHLFTIAASTIRLLGVRKRWTKPHGQVSGLPGRTSFQFNRAICLSLDPVSPQFAAPSLFNGQVIYDCRPQKRSSRVGQLLLQFPHIVS
jgi:hypothetical protein